MDRFNKRRCHCDRCGLRVYTSTNQFGDPFPPYDSNGKNHFCKISDIILREANLEKKRLKKAHKIRQRANKNNLTKAKVFAPEGDFLSHSKARKGPVENRNLRQQSHANGLCLDRNEVCSETSNDRFGKRSYVEPTKSR